MAPPNEVKVVLKTERFFKNGGSDDEEGNTAIKVKSDDATRIGDAEFFPGKGYLQEWVALVNGNVV